ncbi:TerC family protein [Anaplasma capra]|uniref:TerC family protein n=1 Tax=Anaplasma capra TaxID=1562740 RepID=UPI0021D5AA6A|nr:TerC family protein [Anaplasma capra]MCU7611599.1 TerC family protein [Anaplasma capra]MCU7611961.1 TerC family protein [Anaplasma capra]
MSLSYCSVVEFFTLLFLEMILGIDNLIFIALITSKLPKNLQNKARICGLGTALVMRFAMLFGASFLLSMNEQLIAMPRMQITYRDMFFIAGGAFLVHKSAKEIYLEIFPKKDLEIGNITKFFPAIMQIIGIDLVLSLDSVISAVGITDNMPLIVLIFSIYVVVALFFSKEVAKIVQQHERVKIIALLFIGALGVLLVADGVGVKIPHNYLYVTLIFPVIMEYIDWRKGKHTSLKR